MPAPHLVVQVLDQVRCLQGLGERFRLLDLCLLYGRRVDATANTLTLGLDNGLSRLLVELQLPVLPYARMTG